MAKVKVVVEGWVELPDKAEEIIKTYNGHLDFRGMVQQDFEDDSASWLCNEFNVEKIFLHNYGSMDVIDMNGDYPSFRREA